MLPRAAQRALRLPLSASPRSNTTVAVPLLRKYASNNSNKPRKPAPPPPVTSRAPPPRSTPPRDGPRAATGQARQTSPGTSIPKDQTWKPKDGIRLDESRSSTVSAGAVGGATAATAAAASRQTPVDGTRPEGTQPGNVIPDDENAPQEPLAQKFDADEPVPGSTRDAAHDAQAAAENTPPPETPAPDATEAQQPQQPLPDLRYGIPSTFDFEYGTKKQKQKGEESAEQEGAPDLTYGTAEGRERRKGEREERDYDRSAYETSLDRRRAQVANWLYATITFTLATGGFYLARPFSQTEEVPSGLDLEDAQGWAPGKMYARVRGRMGHQLGYYTEPTFPKLLPDVPLAQRPPFTLVLSLEDLMIHSSWDRTNGYRTAKRPGIDYFVRYLSQYYEIVLFTSVPIAMADPIIRKLDPYHFIAWPLGREATKYEGGEYIKDLSYLNRDLSKTLIVDTHAPHVRNQPENAVLLPKWSGDPKDPHTKDLVGLIPFLEYIATMGIDDVRPVLKSFEGTDIATEFARRENEARKKFNEQLAAEKSKRPRRSLGSLASGLGIKSSPAMSGGMVLADGQSVSDGLAQGKMLSDQIREQGQKQYEHVERQIRENGAQWLKEEEEEQKRLMELQMKDMKKGAFSWFGGGGAAKE